MPTCVLHLIETRPASVRGNLPGLYSADRVNHSLTIRVKLAVRVLPVAALAAVVLGTAGCTGTEGHPAAATRGHPDQCGCHRDRRHRGRMHRGVPRYGCGQKRINDSDVAGAAKEVSDFAKTLPDGISLKVDVCTVAAALDR